MLPPQAPPDYEPIADELRVEEKPFEEAARARLAMAIAAFFVAWAFILALIAAFIAACISRLSWPTLSIRNPLGLNRRQSILASCFGLVLVFFIFDRTASYAYLPEENSREVVILTSKFCPHSRAMRARLERRQVPYRELDISEEPLGGALAMWAFQTRRFPVAVIGKRVVWGDHRYRIADALDQLGYGRVPLTAEVESAYAASIEPDAIRFSPVGGLASAPSGEPSASTSAKLR